MLHTRIYCVSYYYYYITEEYLVGINPSAECVFRDWTGRGVCAVLYKRINGYEWLWSVSSLSLSLSVYTYVSLYFVNQYKYVYTWIHPFMAAAPDSISATIWERKWKWTRGIPAMRGFFYRVGQFVSCVSCSTYTRNKEARAVFHSSSLYFFYTRARPITDLTDCKHVFQSFDY
jgi:hypothetical protein